MVTEQAQKTKNPTSILNKTNPNLIFKSKYIIN